MQKRLIDIFKEYDVTQYIVDGIRFRLSNGQSIEMIAKWLNRQNAVYLVRDVFNYYFSNCFATNPYNKITYYENESDIEREMNLNYQIEDLKDQELEILHNLKHRYKPTLNYHFYKTIKDHE